MVSKSEANLDFLADRFIASFEKLDDLWARLDPIAERLAIGESNEYGYKRWRPIKVVSDRSLLDPIYAKLPAPFPPLFERLVLSYRWAEVDLQSFRVVANPPGSNLAGLFEQISKDKGLWDCLLPSGYIRFGKGPDIDYDPVCFDIKVRNKQGDYRIVKIDHEEILCNNRVKVIAQLASSFEELARRTIEEADRTSSEHEPE